MSRITQDTINAVLDRADIADIIGSYIELKKAGTNFKGLCPFHNEKTPSFQVNPARRIYKCFGCSAGGNVVNFVMLHERLNYPDAIKAIAAKCNVSVEYEEEDEVSADKRAMEEKTASLKEWAAQQYAANFKNLPDDSAVKTDFFARGYDLDDVIRWQIGYAPGHFKFLSDKIVADNMLDAGKLAGLCSTKDEKIFDFFVERIMFPISDMRGKVVGFSGRSCNKELGENGKLKFAKYKNSPESAFNKSKTWFGLFQARKAIIDSNYAIVCEGQFDVIRMHQKGFENTIASSGTAVTNDHVDVLSSFCRHVILMQDGDAAGIKSMITALDKFLLGDFKTECIIFPKDEDPDSFFKDKENEEVYIWINEHKQDAIHFKASMLMEHANDDPDKISEACDEMVRTIMCIRNQVKRDKYILSVARIMGVKPKLINGIIADEQKKREEKKRRKETVIADDSDMPLPEWAPAERLFADGFIQKHESEKKFPVGIYFKSNENVLKRYTNFTVRPLYQILDMKNGRRLVEITNGYSKIVAELPNAAFTKLPSFETEVVNYGNFVTEGGFNQNMFKRVANWCMGNMPRVWEMKTLGWQPEGFFAFSNKVMKDFDTLDYNEYGIVEIENRSFLSPSISKSNDDIRSEDNPYENDLFLSYKKSKITFSEWADLFCKVYGDHGPFGIAFVFVTIYKDLVTRITKCPHLYSYGQKGSGKSAFNESIQWLFFSGKNAEGKLIQGINLNPGQVTPFAFFSRMERFANLPILCNEYDFNVCEPWKKGLFKSAYDGEGRVVGDGDSGKKRQSKTQKVKGTLMIVGQYLDTSDDGSVMSRSVVRQFSLKENQERTDEDKRAFKRLQDNEDIGLSSLVAELIQYRPFFKEKLGDEFWRINSEIHRMMRESGKQVEQRVLNNYSLFLSSVKIMQQKISLPFTYESFFASCIEAMKTQSSSLRDNSILQTFWKMVEVLFDEKIINPGIEIKIRVEDSVHLREDSLNVERQLSESTQVLYFRFSNIYAKFAKKYREVTNKVAPPEDTIINYMQDQDYYIGLCNNQRFYDKVTSCQAVKYSALGIDLERFAPDPSDGLPVPDPSFSEVPKIEKKTIEDVPF